MPRNHEKNKDEKKKKQQRRIWRHATSSLLLESEPGESQVAIKTTPRETAEGKLRGKENKQNTNNKHRPTPRPLLAGGAILHYISSEFAKGLELNRAPCRNSSRYYQRSAALFLSAQVQYREEYPPLAASKDPSVLLWYWTLY